MPIHTFCLYSKIELSSLSPRYFTDYSITICSRCQDLNGFRYITVDQSEDPVPFFEVTWMVMYYKKAGRLVLAVLCEFTCRAVGWKYWFIEPARLEKNTNSKLLHFNLHVIICKLFLRYDIFTDNFSLTVFIVNFWGNVGPQLSLLLF